MRSSTPSSLGRRKRGSQSPEKSSGTATTRSTGPYDRAFQQHLIDHGILPDGYEFPDGQFPSDPENIDEIAEALARPRPSLSPTLLSREDFREFKRANDHANKEGQVMKNVIPVIEGRLKDPKCAAGDIPFNNLDHLTDGTLVSGKPDYYHGARPEQMDRKLREELSGLIVPSTQGDLPVAPNFFVEVKGPDGSAAVAKRQITYDTALGERGQVALDDYFEPEPKYNNEAHTLGCTYQDGTLKIYASHRIPPSKPGTKPGYVLTQVNSWSLTGNLESFREGITAYRNGREWTKKLRDQAIDQANERATDQGHAVVQQDMRSGLGVLSEALAAETVELTSQATITTGESNAPSSDSETSADELSLGHGPYKQRMGSGAGPFTRARHLRQESQDGRKRTRSTSHKRADGGSFSDGMHGRDSQI